MPYGNLILAACRAAHAEKTTLFWADEIARLNERTDPRSYPPNHPLTKAAISASRLWCHKTLRERGRVCSEMRRLACDADVDPPWLRDAIARHAPKN